MPAVVEIGVCPVTLAAVCWWTLTRAVVLCLLAWPVCRWMERCFTSLSASWRFWFLAGLIAPACFPELVVGYAYRHFAVARPDLAEWLCSVLLLCRIIPVGTIALLATPHTGADANAWHCRLLILRSRLNLRRDWFELARCYFHGNLMRGLPALGLMGIVAFQEFELAALLQTLSWTDWFVAARWQGLDRNEMLHQSLQPVLWQLPILLGVLLQVRLASSRKSGTTDHVADRPEKGNVVWIGAICVIVSMVIGCIVPLVLMGWQTIDGLMLLARQRTQLFGLAREILISSAVATCSTGAAWFISGRLRGLFSSVLYLGLFGSLLLSLGAVAVFQFEAFHPLYDTPVPWVLVLIIWILPRAALLRSWIRFFRDETGIHVAELALRTSEHPSATASSPARMKSRRSSLLWHLRDQPQFLAMSLLWYWAYCDLPSAYMLAPSGMASGLVRLYNFMHFGRSAALSAEALVFFGIPVVVWFLLLIANRKFR
ncbi:MAG: hypothetical protein U0941_10515 [Planctomycetaceae bacterium]